MKKLAIITTHPIQYNAPLFRLLSDRKRIAVKVFYTWGQSKEKVFDAKFGLQRSWDIPLLEGYDYEFVTNVSIRPDSNRFWGIVNPHLIQQLKQEQFDAVLVYRWSLFSHIRIMHAFGERPQLFFRGDSHLFNAPGSIKTLVKKWLMRFVYQNVKRAFYVGQYNKAYYKEYGLENEQLVYAPHAIDNNRFSTEADKWEKAAKRERQLRSIPDSCIVFLYAGKFYALKQLALLIRSFQQLKGKQYRLMLVGNGEQEQELKILARDDERILFEPFHNQSEMPCLYRMGNVFVLPSKSETWGLGVNEAMACSRTAIVSDACGCAPELIVEGKTGFTFQWNNEADLLRVLEKFTDKDMCNKMGEDAFEYIQNFSLDRVAEAIEKEVLSC